MLRRLLIRDFVIVDRLELEFAAGFGALTGETGAGKSILIDALSLALGERADAGVVRPGADKAEVAAEFDLDPASGVAAWLKENDFDPEGGVCLLRRVVDAGGRSRAYINGAAATLTQLKTIADGLADIHGQHAHHSLLRPDAQRQMLDAHGGLSSLAAQVASAYMLWHRLHAARENAEQHAEASAREREMLEWQIQELETLAFDPVGWLEENQEHRRLTHAASLMAGAEAALETLDAGEMAANAMLDQVLSRLRDLVEVDAALDEPVKLIDDARILLGEAVHALSRYRDRLDLDPQRLEQLEARLEAVTGLARKHRVTPDALPELRTRLVSRLEELRLTADPAALAARESAAWRDFEALARKLSEGRANAAAKLSKDVTETMQQLAMVGGRFEIVLVPQEEGASYGLEGVDFRVSANPGQPMRALAKVASGGELSRIGLAIQVIASAASGVPTLIFDEVDVGIGGGVAEIVGRLLRRLGDRRQVLCVTHLPQVAAQAAWQWSIAKETRNGQTSSRVAVLSGADRVEEIARMLGGVEISSTTRQHAREMLGEILGQGVAGKASGRSESGEPARPGKTGR